MFLQLAFHFQGWCHFNISPTLGQLLQKFVLSDWPLMKLKIENILLLVNLKLESLVVFLFALLKGVALPQSWSNTQDYVGDWNKKFNNFLYNSMIPRSWFVLVFTLVLPQSWVNTWPNRACPPFAKAAANHSSPHRTAVYSFFVWRGNLEYWAIACAKKKKNHFASIFWWLLEVGIETPKTDFQI